MNGRRQSASSDLETEVAGGNVILLFLRSLSTSGSQRSRVRQDGSTPPESGLRSGPPLTAGQGGSAQLGRDVGIRVIGNRCSSVLAF